MPEAERLAGGGHGALFVVFVATFVYAASEADWPGGALRSFS